MTNRQIDNRIKKLQNIEAQIEELKAQADKLKDEIKSDMEEKKVDEVKTENFIVRWKEIVSKKLDSKSLKSEYPDLYSRFSKESVSKRFSFN